MSGIWNVTLLGAAEAAEGVAGAYQWWMAIAVGALLLGGLLTYDYRTRGGIIARATTKEAVRQPVFLLLIALGIVIIVVNTFMPFFTLGDDVKMLKDCGLATILICGILLAVWTSSTSIADEIEGKTAMTLLSKPVNRRQFIVGKYLGILQSVLLMLLPLVIVFVLMIYYKVGYDARESSKEAPEHLVKLAVALQILPGVVLILLEIAVMTAVSVAISTRMPMMVNMVSCVAIFVIGHLTPVLVQTTLKELEFVKFMAQLIATALPSLELFNSAAAVARGAVVPPSYLGLSALYCGAYCTAAILLAFILFEDRDLA